MPAYTRDQAKAWTRAHLIKSTNAPPTPFTRDFALDEAGLAENVDRFAATGLHGLMTGGSVAEGWNMTPAEWDRYSAIVARTNKGRMLLTSVILDPSPIVALEKIHRLAALGFDLAEIINPIFQLRSDDDIFGYFEYLSARSPLGIVLYNTPTAGRALGHPLILRLAELEMIVGIKNGLLNPADSVALRKACGEQIVVTEPMEAFYPWDRVMHGGQCLYGSLDHLLMGRRVAEFEGYMALCDAGDMAGAMAAYPAFEPIRDLMNEVFTWNITRRNQYTLAPIKHWMELLGYRMGPVRPPMAPYASAADQARIEAVLRAEGVI